MSSSLPQLGGLIIALVAVANGLVWWRRGTRLHPEKREGYTRLVRAFVLAVGLPALLAELAALGGLPAPVREALGFLAVGIFLVALALGTYWLYFRGGAEELADHPGLLVGFPETPMAFKIVWGLLLASVLLGIVLEVVAS